MDELLKLIKAGATTAGLAVIRIMKPEDFELQVKCGVMDMEVHEAAILRTKLASIADSIGNTTTDRTKKGDWQNVAFNIDPTQGASTRVKRSYGRG